MPIPVGTSPFDRLASQLIADELRVNPVLASALGVTDHDGDLPDLSAASFAARERKEDEWTRRLMDQADGALGDDERVDRDLVLMVLRGRALQRDWADWRRNPDHYAGVALSGVFVLLLHRLQPEPDLARAVAARLRATPELLEQGIANLDPDLAHPHILRRGLGQIVAGAAYARSVAGEFADPAARALVAAAGEQAAAAYERLATHVEALVDEAHGEWAIGEARYDALLREAEGLSYGARELRDRGHAAYDDIAGDMRSRARALQGHGDFLSMVRGFNEDRPETPEEMLELYRQATEAARAFCVEHELVTMPAGERCEVVPAAPFTRSMIAVAHYIQPPPFASAGSPGAGVGHFFVPYPPDGSTPEQVAARLATNNRHGAWSIAVHEAYPGHHWHLAHFGAQLAPDGSTGGARPLRCLFGSTFFVEGWGLYTEDLLREKGFFRTAEQELAQRDFRLFRAARMVVDTSLHLGEMTVEQAVDHLSTHASLSRDTAHTEVLRYCAWPTQAASYLTGALEIDRMRKRWLESGGTLRDFHHRAAGSGRLPIRLVERTLFG